ncbi:cryptochrome/photolyase family protein [Kineosporia succinea]|uniref:Deoxyribodipyrimidine photo-lyase n=1 Tax=Kineosporia succinea TaxID=84632 RepID=A0ABT9P2A3_9ACTN|nr:deoxyribodipyrimidine photo-lyase [Kineosporia succinea]MDP9826813.1 deoxyribodipyrimidine photo-lyase [Kineosporia succinea]
MSDQSAPSVVLFTRDLRVHDNPALHAAAGDGPVVPLFVLDPTILDGTFNRPNRARFLAESLADLDAALQKRGAALVVRRGVVADEVAAVVRETGARAVHMAGDASGFSHRREDRLREALDDCELHVHDDSLFVVPPGQITATGKTHMSVFSPYHRKWEKESRRSPLAAPRKLTMPPGLKTGKVPAATEISKGRTAPHMSAGGETEGRKLFKTWLDQRAEGYADDHDDLAGDRTSRISPYLHFGCLSPLEVVTRAWDVAPAFTRQVAWRDFHAQVLAANPRSTRDDLRPRHDRWRTGEDAEREFTAWKEGRTGWPLVDACMRQLVDEGWMHNRGRLVVGHFLCKTLYLDWRWGAQFFVDHLIDGDTANNTMNWQWVAGTGTDSRFNRILSVSSQAERYDPNGDYVRRHVPELSGIDGPEVHAPWKLDRDVRKQLDYPEPIVDVREGNDRFLAARGKK